MFEVHYSSPKSKSFRQCPFEFCQARFTLLKDLKVFYLFAILNECFFKLNFKCRIIPFMDAGISRTLFGIWAVILNEILLQGNFQKNIKDRF